MTKTKRVILSFSTAVLHAVLLASPIAYAQTARPPKLDIHSTDDLVTKVFCPIINVMFVVLMAVSVIMVIWAAYIYLTSQGDEEKIKKGHKTITYAAIAVAIALLSWGFPSIIASVFNTSLSGNSCAF